MPAGLLTRRHDALRPGSDRHLTGSQRSTHGNDGDARLFPGGDILAGRSGTGGHHRNLFLDHSPGYLFHMGAHQHDIDAEGLIRQGARQADLLLQVISPGVHG